ncbi:unnamed protein product [Closterium sp. Naga37s-1]|nr:unnamed protein product [Closterium sp. Naga37s-1]
MPLHIRVSNISLPRPLSHPQGTCGGLRTPCKLDGTENHLVMSHLRARSTTDVSADMSLGGTTGDNTRLLGRAPEEEEAMQAEGVREVAVATGLEVLYQETPNYRGAAAEADRMIEPRETARHAWRVPDLGVEPVVSAGEEAVTEGG